MKLSSMVAGGLLVMWASAPVYAQAQEGPLADPAAVPAPAKPAKVKRSPPAKAHHRKTATSSTNAPSPGIPPAPAAPSSLPTSHADRKGVPSSTDPVSFGMKWNGANDNGEKTRVQNYDGSAAGTGAAVGMKLHF